MEGDTARIFRLERDMKKHSQNLSLLAEAIADVKRDVNTSFVVLFMFTTILCLSLTAVVMLK